MEVIRVGGNNSADVLEGQKLQGWGASNPTFGRWLPCQGVDIIRNDEYVATASVPGVKQHPTDNFNRIEVEYVAGPLTEQAIDITADRMSANITSAAVEDAIAQAYRACLIVKAEVKRAPKSKSASASTTAANAASSVHGVQIAILVQELEDLKREFKALMTRDTGDRHTAA